MALCAATACAFSACKVNESLSQERTLYEASLPRVGSAEGKAAKFGLGNLTRRQHSKIVNAAREDMQGQLPLQPGQAYVDGRIEVTSKHFFLFRMSRATFKANAAQVE